MAHCFEKFLRFKQHFKSLVNRPFAFCILLWCFGSITIPNKNFRNKRFEYFQIAATFGGNFASNTLFAILPDQPALVEAWSSGFMAASNLHKTHVASFLHSARAQGSFVHAKMVLAKL